MPFQCSICGEESTRICVRCTKDACDNHLCDKCRRCSDCCECEVALSPHVPESVRSVIHGEAAHATPLAEPIAETPPAVERPPVPETSPDTEPAPAPEASTSPNAEPALAPETSTSPNAEPAPAPETPVDAAPDSEASGPISPVG
jgi:hypothetical protein